MTIFISDDFTEDTSVETIEKKGFPVGGGAHCTICGREMKKWINYAPLGDFCPSCAQHIMRCLLEDLIRYYYGDKVSLLGIMYHGDTVYPEREFDKQGKIVRT